MTPRLKIAYDKEITNKLMSKLSVKNKHQVPKIEKIMHDWYSEGTLKFKADITNGLENVLISYKRMFNGDNVGKTLVKL